MYLFLIAPPHHRKTANHLNENYHSVVRPQRDALWTKTPSFSKKRLRRPRKTCSPCTKFSPKPFSKRPRSRKSPEERSLRKILGMKISKSLEPRILTGEFHHNKLELSGLLVDVFEDACCPLILETIYRRCDFRGG